MPEGIGGSSRRMSAHARSTGTSRPPARHGAPEQEQKERARGATATTLVLLLAAARRGLLLLKAGLHGSCIRVLCPLVISDAELDEAAAAWEDALEAVLAR